MTYLAPALQRLCDGCQLLLWLHRHHSQSTSAQPGTGRFLCKRQRAHLMLILRAQWYGFDRNETIYLLKLFDETHGAVAD